MQFLIFHLGDDRYGLDTRQVRRVLPLMTLKSVVQAPPYVAGLMNFHGSPVPVIDLNMLARGTASSDHFDTRIVLVEHRSGGAEPCLLGIIAEAVTGIERIEPDEFAGSGIDTGTAPYLGKVTARDGALLQLVEVDHLLTADARAMLFPPEVRHG